MSLFLRNFFDNFDQKFVFLKFELFENKFYSKKKTILKN